jgi:hypothetical protein
LWKAVKSAKQDRTIILTSRNLTSPVIMRLTIRW